MKPIDVEPFLDSTQLLGDAAALRRRFREHGYLFLKQVLPRKVLSEACSDMMRVIGAAGWLKEDASAEERIVDCDKACVEPEPEFRRVYDKVYALERFHAVPHEEALIRVLRDLLDIDEMLVHPRKIGRLIFPTVEGRVDFSTPAHQDYWALQGSPDTVTAWIPLHDCPFEHGSLMVADGTHRDGIFSYRLALGAGAVEVDAPLEGRWRGGDFAAGDVVLFSTLTVHKAAANRTRKLRLSLDCRYQRPQDPITEPCIDLKGVAMDWETIYRNWSDSTLQYYWRKWDLQVVPYSSRYYDRRDQLAFEEGEKGNVLAVSSLQRLAQYHPEPAVRQRAQAILDRLVELRP